MPDPLASNPRAAALAGQYNAPYAEVAAFFEQGYADRDIERAYRLGKERDAEPGDILAMLDVGMDWRQIDKALTAIPDPGDTEDDDDESAFGESPKQRRKRK